VLSEALEDVFIKTLAAANVGEMHGWETVSASLDRATSRMGLDGLASRLSGSAECGLHPAETIDAVDVTLRG